MTLDYSIVIPAYNEEECVGETLKGIRSAMQALEESDGRTGEIILVDNNSTDRTAEIAAAYGARVVFEPVNCIARARNAGAAAATGKFLVFVDADTLISPELLRMAVANMATGKACAGGARIAFIEKVLPWTAPFFLGAWHSLIRIVPLAAGSFIYCTREAFDWVGGFDDRLYAGEEIRLSIGLKRYAAMHSSRFSIIHIPVQTSGRKFKWFSTAYILSRGILFLFFPFLLRNKRSCSLWYDSPRK